MNIGRQPLEVSMTPAQFESLRIEYARNGGYPLLLTDTDGKVLAGEHRATNCQCKNLCESARMESARQTLQFGEPIISLCCDNGYARWAVPLMDNSQVTGALVVEGVDLESAEDAPFAEVQKAADRLMELAIRENLTNGAALRLARIEAGRERERFLLIEASKEQHERDNLRTLYLREEPELLTAIKEGNKPGARAILNRILTAIYAGGEDDLELLKSCLLELVVMMSRAAVEAGAEPTLTLGNNYRFLSDLAAIDDQEDLAIWIREMLESLIDRIHRSKAFPHFMVLNKALAYMQEHLHEPLKREDVARHVGISPSHFSKLMTERLGRSFSELLNQIRIEKARQLMSHTDHNLTSVALECGYFDQSHFNRAFRKATGQSPGAFRKDLYSRHAG